MGPCISSDNEISPTENWGQQPEELNVENTRRRTVNGVDVDVDDQNEKRPEDDGEFFEFEADEVREGE